MCDESRRFVSYPTCQRNRASHGAEGVDATYHGPQQEGQFERIVEGNPVKHKVHKDFQNTKNGKDNPVDKPLGIVSLGFALNRLERFEGRVHKAHEAGKRGNADAKDENQKSQNTTANHQELFGGFRLFL